ncbi:MAG: galactokinase [Clostridiales bacterium]|nr:galactokinase [Clostridiales bacterium]
MTSDGSGCRMNRARLAALYGADRVSEQLARYEALAGRHAEKFGACRGLRFLSAPGRTEIAGNHTDHNHGRVLAAAVDLDTLAAATPSDDGRVVLYSEGFARPFEVDLGDLSPRPAERETSSALIRGVAARMASLGYRVGGFRACATSTVLKGSGLSSSAAFEVLICAIFDALYNGFTVDAQLRARIAQYAENEYFGKPCGLMDQMASSVGGLVAIDFGAEPADVRAMSFDFAARGYALAVVSAGGEHGNLTAEYAAIPGEMREVARLLGKTVLRDLPQNAVMDNLARLKGAVSDRAILRALHFADENERVLALTGALARGDVAGFFGGIIASGESSWMLLQNLYVPGGDNQEMALALEMSRRLLRGKGAWRIHGGGFAGTILAFVPLDDFAEYAAQMDAVFGAGAVARLNIRSEGAALVEA